MEFAVDDRPHNPVMYWVFGISMCIAAFTMSIEAKRDLHAFCMFTAVATFVTGIVTGAVALLGMKPHPIAASVAILCGLIIVFCLVHVLKNQYGKEFLPNILMQSFPQSAIYEVDGMHFASTQSHTEVLAGQGFEIQVFVQNCWDTEKTFTFGLKIETRLSFNRAGMKFCKEPKISLPGGTVSVMSIPVVAEAKAKGKYSIVASPRVTGSAGTRIRRRRAQGYRYGNPTWITLLGPLAGILVRDGGMKFKVNVAANKQETDTTVELPEIASEVIWKPEQRDLIAASRALA